MSTIFLIILVACATSLLFCFYMLHRVEQLSKMRQRWINEEYTLRTDMINNGVPLPAEWLRYDHLESWDHMLDRFWIPLKKYERPLSDFYDNIVLSPKQISNLCNIGKSE